VRRATEYAVLMATEPPALHQLDRPLTLRQAIPSTALAVLLSAVVILTLLGHNRLTDWDEGIYAQVSREMLSRPFDFTTWLVPHWNSFVWIDKPPLTYWITALFFKLFGVSEFTARLGSALAAIATVKLLHYWLLRTRGLLAAWLSSVILLSTFGFLHIARVGETDTLLSFGSLLALIGLSEVLRPPTPPSNSWLSNPAQGWYLYWTGFAIALMSKSAASGTLFLTLLILLALDPTLRRRARAPFFYAFLLFLTLTLPWHLYMFHLYGQVFVRQYLGLHVLGRVAYQFDGHLTPWWYYLRVLLFSAPPWVLLYPVALYAAFRPHPQDTAPTHPGAPSSAMASSSPKVGSRDAILRPFAVFAIVQILFFSIVQTRLPHYMAPAYAPFSALVAIWLATHLKTYLATHPSARPNTVRFQFAAAVTLLWIITALLTAHPRSQLHSPRLPNGLATPNNREEVTLLKQVFQHPSPLVAKTPGPLLDWRPGTYNPIPTVLFYANRPVQQVTLQPLPPNTPTDIYAFNPIPLSQALPPNQPRLILIARSLLPQIPATDTFQPLATSPTLELALISRLPSAPKATSPAREPGRISRHP
jgi:4-amino-4-deoxy-L-arabinose transferase-like glycosyltransferase